LPIARPRRIFREGAIAARTGRGGGVSNTLVAGIFGAIGGAALVLIALPADLFGRVPTPSGVVTADAQHVAVVDGDTLRLREMVIRLQGISAPGRGIICGDGSDCGAAAAEALASMVRDRTVSCTLGGRDPSGFPQALCEAGGVQLNRALVSAGFAHARTDTVAFNAEETAARDNHRGLWRGGAF
jgi:endonuclease YncB( thermonuclease family)